MLIQLFFLLHDLQSCSKRIFQNANYFTAILVYWYLDRLERTTDAVVTKSYVLV